MIMPLSLNQSGHTEDRNLLPVTGNLRGSERQCIHAIGNHSEREIGKGLTDQLTLLLTDGGHCSSTAPDTAKQRFQDEIEMFIPRFESRHIRSLERHEIGQSRPERQPIAHGSCRHTGKGKTKIIAEQLLQPFRLP